MILYGNQAAFFVSACTSIREAQQIAAHLGKRTVLLATTSPEYVER